MTPAGRRASQPLRMPAHGVKARSSPRGIHLGCDHGGRTPHLGCGWLPTPQEASRSTHVDGVPLAGPVNRGAGHARRHEVDAAAVAGEDPQNSRRVGRVVEQRSDRRLVRGLSLEHASPASESIRHALALARALEATGTPPKPVTRWCVGPSTSDGVSRSSRTCSPGTSARRLSGSGCSG